LEKLPAFGGEAWSLNARFLDVARLGVALKRIHGLRFNELNVLVEGLGEFIPKHPNEKRDGLASLDLRRGLALKAALRCS